MNSRTRYSAIILAGGEGRRAGGRDKGLIEYKGQPLIEHVMHRINGQVDDIVISANRNIDHYKKYSDSVVSDNADTCLGPLAGIAAALAYCKHENALVVACDMPQLPGDLVQRLSGRHENEQQNNIVTIAGSGGHHQLALLIDKRAIDDINQALAAGQLKLIQWVRSVRHEQVSFDDEPLAFANLNHLTRQPD